MRRLVAIVGVLAGLGLASPAADAAPSRTALIAVGFPVEVVDERGAVRWSSTGGAAPAWSPTGDEVAFASPEGGLAIAHVASGEVRTVPGHDGAVSWPRWSPDGSRVAFAGAVVPGGDIGDQHRELFVAPADGCCAAPVTSLPDDGFGAGPPRWTADGERIVVVADLVNDRNDAGGDLLVVDPASGSATKISGRLPGDAVFFDLSPVDDTVAVVVVGRGTQRLWRLGVDGSAPTPLMTVGSVVPVPAWSPDGRWIAAPDAGGLAVVRPDGSGHRQVAALEAAGGTGPSWLPDSRRLAYVAVTPRSADLVIAGLSGAVRLVRRDVVPASPAVSPVFSPMT